MLILFEGIIIFLNNNLICGFYGFIYIIRFWDKLWDRKVKIGLKNLKVNLKEIIIDILYLGV